VRIPEPSSIRRAGLLGAIGGVLTVISGVVVQGWTTPAPDSSAPASAWAAFCRPSGSSWRASQRCGPDDGTAGAATFPLPPGSPSRPSSASPSPPPLLSRSHCTERASPPSASLSALSRHRRPPVRARKLCRSSYDRASRRRHRDDNHAATTGPRSPRLAAGATGRRCPALARVPRPTGVRRRVPHGRRRLARHTPDQRRHRHGSRRGPADLRHGLLLGRARAGVADLDQPRRRACRRGPGRRGVRTPARGAPATGRRPHGRPDRTHHVAVPRGRGAATAA
jgi:hypothetical protein